MQLVRQASIYSIAWALRRAAPFCFRMTFVYRMLTVSLEEDAHPVTRTVTRLPSPSLYPVVEAPKTSVTCPARALTQTWPHDEAIFVNVHNNAATEKSHLVACLGLCRISQISRHMYMSTTYVYTGANVGYAPYVPDLGLTGQNDHQRNPLSRISLQQL